MKTNIKYLCLGLFLTTATVTFSQVEEIKLDPIKVQQFLPYMEWKHGGKEGFPAWKNTNKRLYALEMWYYSESFYVKRNYFQDGLTLDESIIDISRFEKNRKENEESVVVLPGYKDVLVMLPANKLIYKLP